MNRRRFAPLTFAVLCGAYLIQLLSPLRTNNDATVLLDLAASASDGKGFLLDGKRTHFPIGYPLIVAALDRAGLACSASLIGLNLGALALGMAATAVILRRSFRLESGSLLSISILTLLCWVFIKHVTLPLSDLPYFGLAQACLALLTWSSDRPRRTRLVAMGLALLLASAAIATRTVGIALLPAFAFACLPATPTLQVREVAMRHRGLVAALAIGLVGLCVLACQLIVQTQYFHECLERWSGRIGVGELASYKLSDWGELVINTPEARLPGPIRGVVGIAGLLVPIMLAWGVRLRDRLAAVDVYTAGYLVILLFWPYQDARFWIPVFPIFLGYAALIWERTPATPAVRRAGAAYLGAFGLLGVFALAYSTWISLAHDRFPDRFAGGVYRASYRAALNQGTPAGDRGDRVDPQIVRLVQRYSRPSR
jgi:hypothetical protein